MAKIVRNGLRVAAAVVHGDIFTTYQSIPEPVFRIVVAGEPDDGQASYSLEFDTEDAEMLICWLARSLVSGADARGSKNHLTACLRALARRADANDLGPRPRIPRQTRAKPAPAARLTAAEQRRALKGDLP